MVEETAEGQKKQKSLRGVFILAAVLAFFDAFAVSQGGLSILVGAWMLLVALPRALFFTKDIELKSYRMKRAAVYIFAALAVVAYVKTDNLMARDRAETVIAAVKAYNEKNGGYPETLEKLTPEFIERVPIARYSLMYNTFAYSSKPGMRMLYYVETPPFGRRIFNFDRDEWSYLD